MIAALMLGSLLAFSGASRGQEFTGKFAGYVCTVRSAYVIGNGVLSPSAKAASLIGESFRVERNGGRIVDDIFGSDRWAGERILDPGSGTQSFKVVYATPPDVSVRMLVVSEHQKGAMKDFALMDNSDVYAGQCKFVKVKWRRIE